jgi:dTDP-4-amino-4,6-dideoxygalactose transaminase
MTAGEGGMVATNSAETAEFCWSYCNQGRRHGGGWFEHVRLGTNYRLTGFQAAVLIEQMRKLPRQTDIRAANLAHLRRRLRDFPGLTLPDDDPRIGRNPYYLLTLRYHPEHFAGISRDRAIEALQAEGIPVKPSYPYPLYRNPMFGKDSGTLARYSDWHAPQDYSNLHLPEAERVCQDGVWINHQLLLGTEADVDDIILAIDKLQRDAKHLCMAKGAAPQGPK